MATVINIPADKRLSSLGRGLGQIAEGFVEKREEEERRQKFIDAITIVKDIAKTPGPTTADQFSDLTTSLIAAGQEDKVGDFTNMLSNLKAEQAKQNTLKTSREAAQLISGGDVKGALGIPDITLTQQQQVASIQATLKPKAAKKTQREVTVFNNKGEQRSVLVPSTLDDKGVTAFVQENHPGFSRTKPKAPPKAAAPRTETETERDIQSILTLRNIDKPTPKEKAGARNLFRNRRGVNQELASRFGGEIVEDKFGNLARIDFTGADAEKKRIQYSLASTEVDDVLFAGVDPADAVGQVEEGARRAFETGEWLPQRIQEAGPDVVAQFLAQRNVDAPEIVQFFNDLQNIGTDPEAYRRILEIDNPDASKEDIDTLVKQRFPDAP